MNKVITKEQQQNKVSATDNLKKLANVFFTKQELTMIAEIEKARMVINNVCKNVKQKLSAVSKEPVDMSIPEIKKTAPVLPQKLSDVRDPKKLDASSWGKNKNNTRYFHKFI